jgi:hypothetical protein
MSRINQRPRIEDAIFSLVPAAQLKLEGGVYEGLSWFDSRPKPTEAEIDAEVIRLQAEYDANQYQRDRQYPSIGDQLDMQYHDQLDGTTTWKAAIAKVKSDNPKE